MSALKKRSTHGSVAHSRGQGCRLYLGITHLAVVFKTVIGEWNYLGKDFKVKKKKKPRNIFPPPEEILAKPTQWHVTSSPTITELVGST